MEELKRKSVTLSDVIFGLVDRLPDEERLIAYDSINRPLFHGKEINYKGLPDRVQDVLIVANYELRKMQTKYKNGCSEKRVFGSGAFPCENLGSKNKRKKATKKQAKPSDYYNNINNYIYILNQSINQSVFLGDKTQEALLVLVELAKSVKDLAPTEACRLLEAVERLSEVEDVKVAGKMVCQEELVTQIKQRLQSLKPKDLAAEIKAMFERIDANRTNDKINYSIASLFNLKPIYRKQVSSAQTHGFMSRNYTIEQLNETLDDIDRVNI